MVVDPPIVVNLTLTRDEMNQVYSEMLTISFFSYSQEALDNSDSISPKVMVTPCISYYLEMKCSSLVKRLSWSDNTVLNQKSAAPLHELATLIITVIQSHAEYTCLPQPRGGYI